MLPTRYDHVVFDLDGTLVDSAADLTAAVNEVRRSFGLAVLPGATVTGYIGEGVRRLVERALPADEARLDEALRRFMTYYGAHLLDATRPYPGIAEMLTALVGRGVILSVLTNKPTALSRAILDGLGLLPHFVAVIGGDALDTRKPDPAGLVSLRGFTNTPSARMLVVGDSAIDLQTARAAGFDFCGVAWGFRPADLRAAGAQRIVATPAELLDVVGGIGP